MSESNGEIYKFDNFRLETADKTLWREGEKLSLPIKAVEILTLLIENRGRTVSKEELMEKVWRDTFVDENNLAVMISALRKAFGETKNDDRFIKTIPRRGYRFMHELDEMAETLILERRVVTEVTFEEPELPAVRPKTRIRQWIPAAVSVGILTVVLTVWFRWPGSAPESNRPVVAETAQRLSIAVLPFKVAGENSADRQYLSFGIADALTTRLGRLRALNVRAPSAITATGNAVSSPVETGRKLQVDAVLSGSLFEENGGIRVTTQFVRVSDGSVLWSDEFDAKSTNIIELQDSLTNRIVSKISMNLDDAQRALVNRKSTVNPDAERLYLEGRVHWNERSVESLKKSIGFFERATKIDPDFALAYAGLADSYQLLAEYKGLSTNEAYSKARTNAMRALDIDPELAEAHNSLAYIQAFFDWDWERGEASFKRAIDLNPNYATAHHWYSELLNVMHRFDESWEHLQKAHELDPSAASINADIPHYYFIRHDYQRAKEEAEKMVAKHPDFGYSYMYLYSANEKLGREKEAVDALANLHLYFGEDSKYVFQRQKAAETEGLRGFWRKGLEQVATVQLKLKPEAIDLALAHLHIGDMDKTSYYLEKSLEERHRWFLEITYDPEWDAIRSDPRYETLIKKAGLDHLGRK